MQRVAAFLMTGDPTPALVTLRVRESTTSPGRLKVGFTADMNDHPYVVAGDGQEAPLPPNVAGQTIFVSDEFRLEMN